MNQVTLVGKIEKIGNAEGIRVGSTQKTKVSVILDITQGTRRNLAELSCWDEVADIAENLIVGSTIAVSASLSGRHWISRNSNKDMYAMSINAHRINVIVEPRGSEDFNANPIPNIVKGTHSQVIGTTFDDDEIPF